METYKSRLSTRVDTLEDAYLYSIQYATQQRTSPKHTLLKKQKADHKTEKRIFFSKVL